MPARRSIIREALRSALLGLSETGGNVFASRRRPLLPNELPALLIATGGQDPAQQLGNGKVVAWSLRLRIDVAVKDTDGFEDQADTIAAGVAGRIEADATLSGTVLSIRVAQIGDPEFDYEQEKPVIRLPIILEAIYA